MTLKICRYIALLICCIQLYSCSCLVRTYAPFSESTPALEDSDKVQLGGNINLLRGEVNGSAVLTNHLAVTASAGARIPLTARWMCNGWIAGIGYYNILESNAGYEIFAGYGRTHFKNIIDSISCTKSFPGIPHDYLVNMDIRYNCFYIKPDIWVRSGSSKFILSLGLKQLYTPHFNFYQQEFEENFVTAADTATQYSGAANIILMEPAFQFRTGNALNFFAEIKLTTVLKEEIDKHVYFNSPKSVFSMGLVYCFRKKHRGVN